MELEPLVIFGIIYAILSVVGAVTKAGKRSRAGQRPQPARPRAERSAPGTFDELLEEMRRQVEGLQDQQHPDSIEAGQWQETDASQDDSWAGDPAVVSTETEMAEWDRLGHDPEAEAELLVQQRIAAALERNRFRREQEEHRARLAARERKQLRQSKPQRMAPKAISLRDAMVWREILSPPVALRDPQERAGNSSL